MPRRNSPRVANANGPSGLVARWRSDADVLRRRGGESLAATLESCAQDLEAWALAWELEALTLDQAAAESGYSYSALQHMVAAKRLRNAGTPHRPRIRRADLPRKAVPMSTGPQLADKVLAARRQRSS